MPEKKVILRGCNEVAAPVGEKIWPKPYRLGGQQGRRKTAIYVFLVCSMK